MAISAAQARAEFTQSVIDVYRELPKPTSFFRSFFPTKTSGTRYVSIEVKRGTEFVAVDVERGTEGNRNQFGKSSQKIYDPPLYKEYMDITQLDLYDRLFGSTEISASIYSQFVEEVATNMSMLEAKIERAYELQCSQVLHTGIVTLNTGTNIDFKRKADSILDLSTIDANRYWLNANTATCTPLADLATGALFLRQYGKVQGGVFNVIMGSTAFSNFLNITNVQQQLDNRRIDLGIIRQPQRDATGAVLHGEVSSGSYLFRIWTYPEYYQDANGDLQSYLDPTYVVVLPEMTNFKLAFAAVQQLITDGSAPDTGAFVYTDFPDQRRKTHDYIVESAGIAVPVGVDMIYTVKVNA